MAFLCPSNSVFRWLNTEIPPVLEDPSCYKLSELSPATWPAFGLVCSGFIYAIFEEDPSKDIYVDLEGQEWPYGIIINGGRNAILTNGGFDLTLQAGCDVGELPNAPIGSHPNSNIHPRSPAGGVILMAQNAVSWVEGVHVKANGIECDCIISRNGYPSQTSAQAQVDRQFYVINSRFEGWENQGATANPNIGDGLHGDLFQNQGANEPLNRLVFENVEAYTSGEGIVNGSSLLATQEVSLNNFKYDFDPDYINDDYLDSSQQGVALATNAQQINLNNVWYRNGQGGPLAVQDNSGNNPAGTYFVDPNDANGNNLLADTGLTRIPGSSSDQQLCPVTFAPESRVGINYQSPYNYSYCT